MKTINEIANNFKNMNGEVLVSSRVVAEDFGKLHKDITNKIVAKLSSAMKEKSPLLNWFIESYYIDARF